MSDVSLRPWTIVDGRKWKLYSVEYTTNDRQDGMKFSTYLYAIDYAHALMILDELKDTAKIAGAIA